jgi:hypothetical protein
MNQLFTQLEDQFNRLPTADQLQLLERLIHNMRYATVINTQDIEQQLALMALDPEIQNELAQIEEEFSNAEFDGLENH